MKRPGTSLRALLAGFLSSAGIFTCEVSFGTIQSVIGQCNEPPAAADPALTGAGVETPEVPVSLHHSVSLLQRQHLLRKNITCGGSWASLPVCPVHFQWMFYKNVVAWSAESCMTFPSKEQETLGGRTGSWTCISRRPQGSLLLPVPDCSVWTAVLLSGLEHHNS